MTFLVASEACGSSSERSKPSGKQGNRRPVPLVHPSEVTCRAGCWRRSKQPASASASSPEWRASSSIAAESLRAKFLSAFVVLVGAELNTEMELQTAKDTTAGPTKPMGDRDAHAADHVAEAPR
jgi:hypothetical protein